MGDEDEDDDDEDGEEEIEDDDEDDEDEEGNIAEEEGNITFNTEEGIEPFGLRSKGDCSGIAVY
jgi:hypothetical protein